MYVSDELGMGGIAALGAIGSVCAVLLRSTHQNLKALDAMRRDAVSASAKLREELHDHDETIFKLQGMCADYRYALAKLEAERNLLRRQVRHLQSLQGPAKTDKNQITNPKDVI